MNILEVKNLSVQFSTHNNIIKAVDDVSFSMRQGEVLGIAGESGSGKTVTALSLMGLLPYVTNSSGSICFMGKEIIGLSAEDMNKIRGNEISMIFQDPMTSLNPYLSIASQMTEVLMLHKGNSYKEALKTSIDFLELTRIPDAKNRIHLYPYEFSGGMRQRVMIAMSLLCHPKLLIADEPTTALDVTIQAQILHILKDLQREFQMSILIITHDMGVIANICDRVQIMYAGQIMEKASTQEIFYSPQHPYTQALLRTIPRMDNNHHLMNIPGEPPNLAHLPEGCVFQARCSKVHETCRHGKIIMAHPSKDRAAKCNLVPNNDEEKDDKIA